MSPQGRRPPTRRGSAGRERAPAPPEDRSACSPCHGTGKLISGLNGEPHEVECPWCGATGRFDASRDAQAEGPAEPQAGGPAEPTV